MFLTHQKEIFNKNPFNNYEINPPANVLATVISSNMNFFKENPRHRTKTEAEEDFRFFEIKKDEVK